MDRSFLASLEALQVSEALAYDQGKPDYTLLSDFHPGALDDVIRILEFGTRKYERGNWAKGRGGAEFKRRRHASLMRHAFASLQSDIDPEHGFPHMCAIIVNALMVESFRRWELEDQGATQTHVVTSIKDRISGQCETPIYGEYYGYQPSEVIGECWACDKPIRNDDAHLTYMGMRVCSNRCRLNL